MCTTAEGKRSSNEGRNKNAKSLTAGCSTIWARCRIEPGVNRTVANEVRLWLSVIAYNVGNLWRRWELPHRIGNWSLTSLQRRLVRAGGRLVKHARYYSLLLADSHLTKRLFRAMLRRIEALSVPSG